MCLLLSFRNLHCLFSFRNKRMASNWKYYCGYEGVQIEWRWRNSAGANNRTTTDLDSQLVWLKVHDPNWVDCTLFCSHLGTFRMMRRRQPLSFTWFTTVASWWMHSAVRGEGIFIDCLVHTFAPSLACLHAFLSSSCVPATHTCRQCLEPENSHCEKNKQGDLKL